MKRIYRGNAMMIEKVLACGAQLKKLSTVQSATDSDADKQARAEAKRQRRAQKRSAAKCP